MQHIDPTMLISIIIIIIKAKPHVFQEGFRRSTFSTHFLLGISYQQPSIGLFFIEIKFNAYVSKLLYESGSSEGVYPR